MVKCWRMVNQAEIQRAKDCLSRGGVVAIPTDTLYGLAADATNSDAVNRVYEIKGRPANMPLPVLVSGWEQVGTISSAEGKTLELAGDLAERFWPGPLTIVLPAATGLPARLTGGLDTIGVRMPDHAVPLALAGGIGKPITGTSANPSGWADITELSELRSTLGGMVDVIITSGAKPMGTASTIVAISDAGLTLLRPGALKFEDVRRAGGVA